MGNKAPKDTTPPVITSPAYGAAASNAKLAVALTASETATYAITGGDDKGQFEISGTTLRWINNGMRNANNPLDQNKDNLYLVQITAVDAAGNKSLPLTIIVTVTASPVPPGVFFPFFV